ncbi:MAG: hypothetical protein EBZ48_00525 [Proteobacteria bacterium]|nr:hypothetical protein [Pseudomonadota bacterium]
MANNERLKIISKLRESLDAVFERFRRENASINVQAQLDRWRAEARKVLNQVFGSEEGDVFNSIALNIGFSAGLYDSQDDLLLDYIQRAAAYLEALEGAIDQGSESRAAIPNPNGEPNVDPARIFVVQGRNNSINRSVYAFLRSLGLKPYEWEEVVALVGTAPYIGDIIATGMKQSQATVVVLTPDETVSLRPELRSGEDLSAVVEYQPRPNVLFEAGMALAIDEKRTIILEIGSQRTFSDIFGRHLIRLDNTSEKRNAFAGRLRTAGCPVTTNGDHWLSEGNFSTGTDKVDRGVTGATPAALAIELSESEQKIIKAIAEKKTLTDKQLTRMLGESDLKVEYYLQRLSKAGLVGAILSMAGDPPRYILHEAGTKYAVEVMNL